MTLCKSCGAVESEVICTMSLETIEGEEMFEGSYCSQCEDSDCFKEVDAYEYETDLLDTQAEKAWELRKDK